MKKLIFAICMFVSVSLMGQVWTEVTIEDSTVVADSAKGSFSASGYAWISIPVRVHGTASVYWYIHPEANAPVGNLTETEGWFAAGADLFFSADPVIVNEYGRNTTPLVAGSIGYKIISAGGAVTIKRWRAK